jgi:predicted ATP-grasp superfamily ATP-dependent carboligase
MTRARDTVPAIVIGSGLTALGALRLLGRAGVPLYCLARYPEIEARSRWYRPLPGFRAGPDSTAPLADILARCPLPSAVLLPCSDHAVNEIAALPPALAARFPASVSPPTVVAQLTDKARFAALLERVAVPRPLTVAVGSPDDVRSLPDAVFADAFLKPCDSSSFFARYGCKALRVGSRKEAVARLTELGAAGVGVILQEFIPGAASSHYLIDGFSDASGRVRALFARRRMRIYPADFGNSSYMVSVTLTDVAPAAEALRAILASLGYRGIFSAEFKLDERSGEFKILEINARAWWYVEFAGRCGIDVCRMAYDDALGRPVGEQRNYRAGARLIYPYIDLFAAREEWRAGRLSLAGWARSWLGAQQPHFNWSDPEPAIRDWAAHTFDAVRRLF